MDKVQQQGGWEEVFPHDVIGQNEPIILYSRTEQAVGDSGNAHRNESVGQIVIGGASEVRYSQENAS